MQGVTLAKRFETAETAKPLHFKSPRKGSFLNNRKMLQSSGMNRVQMLSQLLKANQSASKLEKKQAEFITLMRNPDLPT